MGAGIVSGELAGGRTERRNRGRRDTIGREGAYAWCLLLDVAQQEDLGLCGRHDCCWDLVFQYLDVSLGVGGRKSASRDETSKTPGISLCRKTKDETRRPPIARPLQGEGSRELHFVLEGGVKGAGYICSGVLCSFLPHHQDRFPRPEARGHLPYRDPPSRLRSSA